MATHIVRKPEARVEEQAFGQKVRDFFTSLAEMLRLYFGSPMTLYILDPRFRANLSVKEKAEIDAALHGF